MQYLYFSTNLFSLIFVLDAYSLRKRRDQLFKVVVMMEDIAPDFRTK